MEREQRNFDSEGDGKGGEEHPLGPNGQVEPGQIGEGERCRPFLGGVGEGETDDRRQHQRRAEGCVDEELDRGVDPALGSPDADDEVHRDQHRLEEDEEKEEVEGQEGADHAGLEEQRVHHELLGPIRDRRRCSQGDRDQQSGEDHHRKRDPVDPEIPGDSPRLVPGHIDDVLKPCCRLEHPEQISGEGQRHHGEGDAEGKMDLSPTPRDQRHDDGGGHRQQDQGG